MQKNGENTCQAKETRRKEVSMVEKKEERKSGGRIPHVEWAENGNDWNKRKVVRCGR